MAAEKGVFNKNITRSLQAVVASLNEKTLEIQGRTRTPLINIGYQELA